MTKPGSGIALRTRFHGMWSGLISRTRESFASFAHLARNSNAMRAFTRRSEWLGLIALSTLIRLMPLDIASWVLGKSWRIFAPLNHRHRRARAHMRHALPTLTHAQRSAFLGEMWENLGRTTAETLQLDRLGRRRNRVALRADSATLAAARDPRGVIFVSLHTANWEIAGAVVGRLGRPPVGVYQAMANPLSDEILAARRRPFYGGGLLKKGPQTARQLIAAARSGAVITLMADLRDKRGHRVTFFGRPALATQIPATLARGQRLPLIAGRAIRRAGVHFTVELMQVPYSITGDRRADIAGATQAIHDLFETWIREYPGQWMWIHRKWAYTEESRVECG